MKERMRRTLSFLGLIEDEYGEYANSLPSRPFTDQPGYEEEPEWSSPGVGQAPVPSRPFPSAPASTMTPPRTTGLGPRSVSTPGADPSSIAPKLRPIPSPRIRPVVAPAPTTDVMIFFPENYNAVSEITHFLRDGHTVLLNVTDLDADSARRVVDFTAGTSYALEGEVTKLANGVFLVKPRGVSVSEDVVERLARSNYRSLAGL